MGDKADVWQGTLALMVLKTIETMGPHHGYGIARRIEQTSGGLLVACAPETVNDALDCFRREGFQRAAVIGEIEAGSPGVTVAS